MSPQKKYAIMVPKSEGIIRIFTKSLILVLIPVMFLHLTLINASDKAPGRRIPFQPGEKLTYQGKWGVIPAGELTLEVRPKEILNGKEVYHFVMITKTSKVVDLIYKIREQQDSYADVGMTHSVLYKKKTESPHPRDESITFNWEKLEATYTNFGQKNPPISILPGTFDPLALFYALRLRNLKENTEVKLPMTDGNKLSIEARAIIGKKEVLEIGGIMYDTIEVTPNMDMLDKIDNADKVVKKSDNPQLRVWVTADEKKIPIRLRSKVGIVTFDFDLVSGL